MRSLVQFGVFFFLLWRVPWFGSVGDEAKMSTVGLLAIGGSLLLTFLVDLVTAPTKIDANQVYEITSLRRAIRKANEFDRASREMSALWRQGRSVRNSEGQNEWIEAAREKIRAEFDAQAEHRFESAILDNGFTGALAAVDYLASNAALNHRGAELGNPLAMEAVSWAHQGTAYTEHTETWSDLDDQP